MFVRVCGYLTLRNLIGKRDVEIQAEEANLETVLQMLARELGANFRAQVLTEGTYEPQKQIAILINGRHYAHLPDKLKTCLADGDEVAIFPPIVGGSGRS